MIYIADYSIVAKFPIWLAFPTGIAYWPAILAKDSRALPTSTDIDALVE